MAPPASAAARNAEPGWRGMKGEPARGRRGRLWSNQPSPTPQIGNGAITEVDVNIHATMRALSMAPAYIVPVP